MGLFALLAVVGRFSGTMLFFSPPLGYVRNYLIISDFFNFLKNSHMCKSAYFPNEVVLNNYLMNVGQFVDALENGKDDSFPELECKAHL
jgi:hypothetical protein